MAEYYNTPGTASGVPKYYANWDANFWVVAPTPNASYEITLAYIKSPTSLTDSSVSGSGTYLSNKYQDLLLYGSLVEAYGYLKGPADMIQYYTQAYKKLLKRTRSNNKVVDAEANMKMVLFVLHSNQLTHHNRR